MDFFLVHILVVRKQNKCLFFHGVPQNGDVNGNVEGDVNRENVKRDVNENVKRSATKNPF